MRLTVAQNPSRLSAGDFFVFVYDDDLRIIASRFLDGPHPAEFDLESGTYYIVFVDMGGRTALRNRLVVPSNGETKGGDNEGPVLSTGDTGGIGDITVTVKVNGVKVNATVRLQGPGIDDTQPTGDDGVYTWQLVNNAAGTYTVTATAGGCTDSQHQDLPPNGGWSPVFRFTGPC